MRFILRSSFKTPTSGALTPSKNKKTLKAIFRVCSHFGNAAPRHYVGAVALRPSITASLPLSVGKTPNCQNAALHKEV